MNLGNTLRRRATVLLLYDGTLSTKNQCLALGSALSQASVAGGHLPSHLAHGAPTLALNVRHYPLRLSALPPAVHGFFLWLLHRISGERSLLKNLGYEGVDLESLRETELIIACGRKTAPLSFALSRLLLPKRPMNVHMNHPRCGKVGNRKMFDIIVAPRHDLQVSKDREGGGEFSKELRLMNRFGDQLFLPIVGSVTMDRRLSPLAFTGFVKPKDIVFFVGGPTHREGATGSARFVEVNSGNSFVIYMYLYAMGLCPD